MGDIRNLDIVNQTLEGFEVELSSKYVDVYTYKGCIMLKDIPLIRINDNGVEVFEENRGYFPIALRTNKKIDIPTVFSWMSNRVIPLNRANAKKLLNMYGLPQGDSLVTARVCKCLSLTDCYWFKSDVDESVWDSVSLYRNKFSDSIAKIAFVGYSDVTIQGRPMTPELTGQGSYAKCWVREDDGIYLYKTNTDTGKESEAEYITSLALDIMGITHVKYELCEYYGRVACKCKLITDEDKSIVPMVDFEVFCNKAGVNRKSLILKNWGRDYYEMLLVDGLLNNVDRHYANWGLFMNANTGKIISLHPLFDHNCAIYMEGAEYDKVTSQEFPNKTLLEVGIYAYKKLGKPKYVEDYKKWLLENKKLFKEVFKDKDKRRLMLIDRVNKVLES